METHRDQLLNKLNTVQAATEKKKKIMSNPEKYIILSDDLQENRKFSLTWTRIKFKLTGMPTNEVNPVEWAKGGVHEIVSYIMREVSPGDKVGFEFTSKRFNKPSRLTFSYARDITFNDVWGIMGSMIKSIGKGIGSDTFKITMTRYQMPCL